MNLRKWQETQNGILLYYNTGVVEVTICTENIARIRYSNLEAFSEEETFIVESVPHTANYSLVQDKQNMLRLTTDEIIAEISTTHFSFSIRDKNGKELLSSPRENTFDTRGALKISRFILKPEERIYGLGQDPMANLDQRGKQRAMWQEWGGLRRSGNAGMPFLLSSSGYGLLLNSSWAARFSVGKGELPDKSVGSDSTPPPWNRNEPSGEEDPDRMAILLNGGDMDIFIIHGPSFDRIHEGYVRLTGHAPMLPRWVFGFIQCNNNYRSQEEFLEIGKKFREKGIPCDVLVKDWLWFKEFGDFCWSKELFPNAAEMLAELNGMGFRVMLSQQPYVDKESLNYERFKQAGFLLRLSDEQKRRPIFDHTNPDARKAWWGLFKNLFDDGIRAYWTDMGEPENHQPGDESFLGCREKMHNIYTLLWNKGLYEGQRSISNERVFLLPRTNYSGIQRYGSALWSGDIDSSWEVLHDQVVIGQGVCLSGQPYWTTDVGGFLTDERFDPELYIRWFEWGAFCPIFRTHGTRPENEPWSFGKEAEEICREFINLRYRLIPYIYSCSRKVSLTGKPIMRAMCMDYGDDPAAVKQTHQYMFGPAFLVAPVTDKGSRIRSVYLPRGEWYDFWSGRKYPGGGWINAHAPLGRIPLFVKAGSIIPMISESRSINHTGEYGIDSIELRVYAGDDGRFELYHDDGFTYEYEKGEHADYVFTYTDKKGQLQIGEAEGNKLTGFDGIQAILLKVFGSNEKLQVECGMAGTVVTQEVKTAEEGESPERFILVDTNLETSGILQVHATFDNSCKAAIKETAFLPPTGWRLLSSEDRSVSGVTHLLWKLASDSQALPLVHKGCARMECTDKNGLTWKFLKAVDWGSGYATRWSILRFPAKYNPNAIDLSSEVEKNCELPHYTIAGECRYWQRLDSYDFNCMGYVDLRSAGFYFSGQLFEDMDEIAYAKCKVWSSIEKEVHIDIAAEPSVKIFVNGKEEFRAGFIVLRTLLHTPVRLMEGWNTILVKVAAVQKKSAFTGRVFDFKFRFTDKRGEALKDLLYMP